MKLPRRWLLVAVVLGCAVVLNGCMKQFVVIHVQPDGSGQIHETFQMNAELVDLFMEGVGEAFGGEGAEEPETPDLQWQENAAEKAGQYGEGVRLVQTTEEEREGWIVCTAVYAFDDVTQLKPQPPKQQTEEPGRAGIEWKMGTEDTVGVLAQFTLTRRDDGTSELVMRMPEPQQQEPDQAPDEEPGAEGGDEMEDEAAQEMLKELFKGMEMMVAVECGTEVLETNATHCEGNRITLAHVIFDEIMALMDDPEKMEALEELGPEPSNWLEAQELLGEIAGLKIEPQPEVRVRFR